MSLYSYEDIMKISISDLSDFEINIDKFINNYIKIERNDKYEPIFSQTSKYKSFPVNGNISKKNFLNNNKWKKKNSDSNKLELKLAFNKLSSTNYDSIKDNIIEILKKETVSIKDFIKELFDKIYFDQSISDIYVKLCDDVWNNKDVIVNNIKIINDGDTNDTNDTNDTGDSGDTNDTVSLDDVPDDIMGDSDDDITIGSCGDSGNSDEGCDEDNDITSNYYYSFNFTKSHNFSSEKELINYVHENNIIKNYIIEEFKKEFNKRHDYIKNLSKTTDEEKLFSLKKKIIGTVEFFGLLYKNNHINFELMCFIIDELLKKRNLIELESFIRLWKIIDNTKFSMYIEPIKSIIDEIDDERILCLLKTLFETDSNKSNVSFNNISYINKHIIDYKKRDDIQDTIDKLSHVNPDILLEELLNNITETFNSKLNLLILSIYKDKTVIREKMNLIEIDEIDTPFGKKNMDLFSDYLNNYQLND